MSQYADFLINGRAWYHLYFVPMIVVFYLLTPLARGVARRSPELLLVLVLAVRVFLGPQIVFAFRGLSFYETLEPLLADIVEHMSFMALGAWFALRKDGVSSVLKRAWPALLGIGAAVWPTYAMREFAIRNVYLERTFEFVALSLLILGFVGLFEALRGRLAGFAPVSRPLADLSYGAYLAHPLVIFLMRKSMGRLGIGSWWDNVAVVAVFFGMALALALLLVRQISRTKGLRYVV